MPTFISKGGKWFPAKETVGLVNKSTKIIKYNGQDIQPGEPFVYKGADREALKMLHEQGVETLGSDFKNDPEFRQAVRNQGFENVEQYLKHIGYDEDGENARFTKTAEEVKSHDIPKKVKEIKTLAGGKDFSGNKDNDVIGGFGDMKLRSANE